MSLIIDEISEMVAKKLNMSPIQVKLINRMQWKFLHKEIQSGDYNSVNIFYIGKFTKKKKYELNKRDNTGILQPNISKSED